MRYFWLMNLAGGTMMAVLAAQSGASRPSATNPAFDWPMYRHDQAGTAYSPLTQIDARNVATLAQAWTYSLQPSALHPPAGGGGRPA